MRLAEECGWRYIDKVKKEEEKKRRSWIICAKAAEKFTCGVPSLVWLAAARLSWSRFSCFELTSQRLAWLVHLLSEAPSRPVVHYVMLPVPLPLIRVQQNLAANQTPTWNETLTSTPSPRHLRPQPPSKRFLLSNDFISQQLSSFSDPSIHLLKRYCPIDICLSSDKQPSRWLANFGTCLRASLPPSSSSSLCIIGSFRHRLATRKAIEIGSHYILLHD